MIPTESPIGEQPEANQCDHIVGYYYEGGGCCHLCTKEELKGWLQAAPEDCEYFNFCSSCGQKLTNTDQ